MSVPRSSNLGPPLSTASLKLPPLVQKQSTGSATGNPRNKCALKPGHSLMDWIRLGNSGCDLSGTKGAIIPVSSKELENHCTQNDAWMAIRGNVYNITRYMDFHPGGPEELMRGVGKDATKLFDEVHAWVNYEQLLKKCLIGPLRNTITIDTDFFKPIKKDLLPGPPTSIGNVTPTKLISRFDWIQKRSDLTLYFYTKQFSNPGLVFARNNEKIIEVRICIANNWHQFNFELYKQINWPPNMVRISSESGKIEINFKKTEESLWPNYGTSNVSDVEKLEDSRYEFDIVQKLNFNHNSFALLLRGKNDTVIFPPVGYHLTFSCRIEEEEINRSYTPVPKKYSPIISEDLHLDLHFLLKTYEKGLLANHINNLQLGSTIILSQPKGNLLLNKFLGHTRIALLAAGSGITPILAVIDHLLARNSHKVENLELIFFNKTEEDIWCRKILKEIVKDDSRLQISHVLSQTANELDCRSGHVSKELLSSIKNPNSKLYSTFICVCGPPTFNTLVENMLQTLDFPLTAMHFFNG